MHPSGPMILAWTPTGTKSPKRSRTVGGMKTNTVRNESRIDPAFFRPNQAAVYCSASRRWLSKQAAAGVLPVMRPTKRLTLYAKSDLDAMLLKHRRGAVSGKGGST